jgi:SAM-dependent methyltransferase
VANDYDGFAEAYSAENEASLLNAYYERPAMLALAGDVAGRRILDAGCGPLFAALRDWGAIVTGFDKSAAMVEVARRRLGVGADLQVADLGSPLPFPDVVKMITIEGPQIRSHEPQVAAAAAGRP